MVTSDPRIHKLTGKLSHVGKIKHKTELVARDVWGSGTEEQHRRTTIEIHTYQLTGTSQVRCCLVVDSGSRLDCIHGRVHRAKTSIENEFILAILEFLGIIKYRTTAPAYQSNAPHIATGVATL